ncbi:MAG: HAD family hydrolase [Candidatus Odinarchaeota archaeon]
MKLGNIRAIIFDLGGTLYKPESDLCGLTREFMNDVRAVDLTEHSDTHIIRALVAPTDWLWNYMIENNVPSNWQPTTEIWIEYDRLLLSALGVTENLDAIAVAYQTKWDKFFEDSRPTLLSGVKPVLETLHDRGFRLGIASNRYTDPTRLLKEDSIFHLFDAIEYTNVPGYAKPSPYMLLRVADKCGLNPGKCAYVGNIVDNDLIAAQRAGMVPILLSWCDPEEVEKITIDTIIIDNISDLLEIL